MMGGGGGGEGGLTRHRHMLPHLSPPLPFKQALSVTVWGNGMNKIFILMQITRIFKKGKKGFVLSIVWKWEFL